MTLAEHSAMYKKERILPLQGAYNVRDLGGYPAASGKTVKWGRVFRSGDLNRLTASDMQMLSNTGLTTIVDFRSQQEIAAAPHKVPETVKEVRELIISAADIVDLSEFSGENGQSLMVKINQALPYEAKGQYTEFFKLLAASKNLPLLFNCSAGKDRTGFAAALFLSALGVERELIYKDYMLSKELVKEKYAPLIKEKPALKAAFTVEQFYLEAAFNVLDSDFGGPENYLANQLEVDLGRMRDIYTE